MVTKTDTEKLFSGVNLYNKKSARDYEILQKYTAGVALKGYEVKAIREKKVSFEGAYVQILSGQPYLINFYIGNYSKNGRDISEEETRRSRRLLLNKEEIEKIRRLLQERGRTMVPLALVSHNNMIKLELAVVKGRKEYGKKHLEKEKQMQKDLERESKDLRRVTHSFE